MQPLPGAACLAFLAATAASGAGLVPAGDFVWADDSADFGGFSDLAMTGAGARMTAISDRGALFEASVERDGKSLAIVAMDVADILRPQDNFGEPVSGFRQDAEDIAAGAGGSLFIAFESYARVTEFRPPDMTAHPTHVWDRFQSLWGNEGFEALAQLPDGRLVAVVETPDGGSYRTMIRGGAAWTDGPRIPEAGAYAASGADVGPDGRFYLLERRHSVLFGYGTRIRRFQPGPDGWEGGEVLLETEAGSSENFEGISVWENASGATMLSLISDNNFSVTAATVIREYRLEE